MATKTWRLCRSLEDACNASYSLKFKGEGYNFNDNLDNVPLESTPSSGKGGFERQLMSIQG